MPGWDDVANWKPTEAAPSDNGAVATETRLPEGDAPIIDVQAVMDAPPATEPLSAEVQGEPETIFTQKKRRQRKPKEVDLLGEMLKQAQFGQMAVVCHTLFYRAIRTPERHCPDLSAEEAQLVDYGTTQYMRYLIETSEDAKKYTPIAALFLCNMIPMLARIQPITEASLPFWERSWNWLKSRLGFARERNS